ncbi:MAG: GNAT family N-acetyltransferase, partial [Proteobacteria bacterium]|nr:GNAT family N-acetyltransferase [Pseudomonadota bacterium]
METEIKPLSAETLDDYLYFFDNMKFHDHPEWSVCYCYSFHYVGAAEEWRNKEKNRSAVIDLVKENRMHGYLAYIGERPIGWCNANDKLNFERLRLKDELWDNDDHKICSVVCFLIDPDQRGKGIASKLLKRVCMDYSKLGYDIV